MFNSVIFRRKISICLVNIMNLGTTYRPTIPIQTYEENTSLYIIVTVRNKKTADNEE